mgnify:CR=1 FL=1
MHKTISIEHLKVGMFVESIEQQAGGVAIKSKGLIKSRELLDNLKSKGVKVVTVNVEKSNVDVPDDEQTKQVLPTPSSTESGSKTNQELTITSEIVDLTDGSIEREENALKKIVKKRAIRRPKTEDAHLDDLSKASELYEIAKQVQKQFVYDLRHSERPDFDSLNQMTQNIIDSVFDNPDALSCMIMLKESNDYLVEHALNCAILLAMFANYQGMTQAEIEDITLAGLLMDVGMATLPADLLQKSSEFSEADMSVIRTHVDIGYELVERFSDVPEMVLDIIAHHHERIDGSGYPKGVAYDAISIYSQMAAIVDTYDAMISERAYRSSVNPTTVLHSLSLDTSLDKNLVNDFINAVGLHPVGSLVLLQSQRLAIVTQRVPDNPLCPNVMAFYNINTQLHTEIQHIQLTDVDDKIISAVRPEEFSINLSRFFKQAFTSPVS